MAMIPQWMLEGQACYLLTQGSAMYWQFRFHEEGDMLSPSYCVRKPVDYILYTTGNAKYWLRQLW